MQSSRKFYQKEFSSSLTHRAGKRVFLEPCSCRGAIYLFSYIILIHEKSNFCFYARRETNNENRRLKAKILAESIRQIMHSEIVKKLSIFSFMKKTTTRIIKQRCEKVVFRYGVMSPHIGSNIPSFDVLGEGKRYQAVPQNARDAIKTILGRYERMMDEEILGKPLVNRSKKGFCYVNGMFYLSRVTLFSSSWVAWKAMWIF